jgi:hypothetical protein
MKEEWLRKVLKVSQKVQKNRDGPDGDRWKIKRIFTDVREKKRRQKTNRKTKR